MAELREKVRGLLAQASSSREQVESAIQECTAACDAAHSTFLERLRTERSTILNAVGTQIDVLSPEDLGAFDVAEVVAHEIHRWSAGAFADLSRQVQDAIEQTIATLNIVSQGLSASYDRSFDLDFSSRLPSLTVTDLKLEPSEAPGFGRSFMRGGLIGFATAVFGPVGILAAALGSAYLEKKLDALKAERAKDRYRAEAGHALSEAVTQLQEMGNDRFRRVRDTTIHALREQADAMVGRFEVNARHLIEQREKQETATAEHIALLRQRVSALVRFMDDIAKFQAAEAGT